MTDVLPARNAVAVVFVLNGFCFASLFSRVPDIRSGLDLGNSALGLLLLAGAAGSVLALPAAGALIRRSSAAAVVRAGGLAVALGLPVAAAGASVAGSVGLTAVGLFVYGAGTGVWDVAMNVEGAAVEQRLGRAIMPRFHAAFSLGTVTGAGVGVLMTAVGVPMVGHLVLAAAAALLVLGTTRAFLPAAPEAHGAPAASAWLEPRTLAVGLMVLAFALTEGSANDWLALALIDGYDTPQWVGVAGFAAFVTAMTAGRMLGTSVLDRFGRVPVLRTTALLALAGLLLLVLGPHPVLVGLGVVLWGLGASLGFPVGMSAAADDPARAAARVSVVSTIGYVAFLAGPPVLGFVGDRVGTLESLLVVAALLVPATLLVSVAREPAWADEPA
ncbi:MFS transporter [Nocardioides euryhalodurans]|uniref:MFS transporter n=1 Tax=Nocardioides euryhalodurans TaxID=2518370 RepID=A0A4P7GID2_9ACTN|nr:MFS transporter [Nocardioides euryhalodurans]QBR91718.1 MFS transporter [Nocardioides euryhalodurans]